MDAWWDSLHPFRADVTAQCSPGGSDPRDASYRVVVGDDDRVFLAHATFHILCSREWPKVEYASDRDFSTSPAPVIFDFSEQLRERGIDLIYMPVPFTEEVYPDALSAAAPQDWQVSPQRTSFLLLLLAANVEVLDLLPLYHAEREAGAESLHFHRDNHWSGVGMRVAAKALASRLSRYEFIQQAQGAPPRYTTRDVKYKRRGTFIRFLDASMHGELPPLDYTILSVEDSDGVPYQDKPGAPVLLIGDSNLEIEELGEFGTQFGGILAAEINQPVTTLSAKGGFTRANAIAARRGRAYLAGRKVIVWIGQGMQRDNSVWRAEKLP